MACKLPGAATPPGAAALPLLVTGDVGVSSGRSISQYGTFAGERFRGQYKGFNIIWFSSP